MATYTVTRTGTAAKDVVAADSFQVDGPFVHFSRSGDGGSGGAATTVFTIATSHVLTIRRAD